MSDLLELTARAEATHFWFHGFRGYVAPAIREIAAGRRDLQILDCVAARDVSGARAAMRQNIEQGRRSVEAAFKEALARAYREQRSGERLSTTPS